MNSNTTQSRCWHHFDSYLQSRTPKQTKISHLGRNWQRSFLLHLDMFSSHVQMCLIRERPRSKYSYAFFEKTTTLSSFSSRITQYKWNADKTISDCSAFLRRRERENGNDLAVCQVSFFVPCQTPHAVILQDRILMVVMTIYYGVPLTRDILLLNTSR